MAFHGMGGPRHLGSPSSTRVVVPDHPEQKLVVIDTKKVEKA